MAKRHRKVRKQTGRRPGNQPFAPTDAQRKYVLTLAGSGTPHVTIASLIGLGSAMTVRKYFVEELRHGTETANAAVAGYLFSKATGALGQDRDSVIAAIFWLKARAGWKDRQEIVHQNPDGTGLFEDWPAEKLLPAMKRAVEVLASQCKAGKKAAG